MKGQPGANTFLPVLQPVQVNPPTMKLRGKLRPGVRSVSPSWQTFIPSLI